MKADWENKPKYCIHKINNKRVAWFIIVMGKEFLMSP